MKTSRNRVMGGFTLVELLVVIGIIAILASVILFAGTTAIKMARRARANNMANQLQTAVLAYYTEYSVYPVPAVAAGGTATDYINTDTDSLNQWGALIECLSGMIDPTSGVASTETTFANTRQVPFLTLKSSDVSATDQPLNPIPPNATQLYYNIAMDADYDGILGGTSSSKGMLPAFSPPTISGTFAANTGTGSSTTGVAIWANCTGSATVVNSNQWVHTY